MEEVLELKVQLAISGRQSQSAAQSSPAVEGSRTTNFGGSNVGTFRMEDPSRRLAGNGPTGSHLPHPVLHTPRVQGVAEEAVKVELRCIKGIARQ